MKKFFRIFALITVIIAFVYNLFNRSGLIRGYTGGGYPRYEEQGILSDEVKKLFLKVDEIKFHTTPTKYYSIYKNSELVGYAFLTTDIAPELSTGYTTQIKTLVVLSVDRKISDIAVIEHYETPQYVDEGKLKKFLQQFKGKPISDKFILGEDIDCITGATITSGAIINSVKEAISRFSATVLKSEMEYSKPVTKHKIVNFILLAAIFLLSIYGVFSRKILSKPRSLLRNLGKIHSSLGDSGKPHSSLKELVAKVSVLRYALLGASIVFLGFYTNTLLSIVNITSNITGKFPSLPGGLFYYFFIAFVIVSLVLCGRLYCGWLCPFGAIEEFICLDTWLSGGLMQSYKMGPKVQQCKQVATNCGLQASCGRNDGTRRNEVQEKHKTKNRVENTKLRNTKYILLWIIAILVFVFDNPNLSNCEPFVTLFNYTQLLQRSPIFQAQHLPKMPSPLGEGVTGFTGNRIFVLLLIGSLLGSIFFYRFYCRYFCPVGAVLGLCSYISQFKLKISTEKCTECSKCFDACKIGAIITDEKLKSNFGLAVGNSIGKYKINIVECIQCNDCIEVCPVGAICR